MTSLLGKKKLYKLGYNFIFIQNVFSKHILSKENGRYNRTASLNAFEMCKENRVSNIMIIFTSFGQNTAGFDDNHILLP